MLELLAKLKKNCEVAEFASLVRAIAAVHCRLLPPVVSRLIGERVFAFGAGSAPLVVTG